MIPGVSVYGVVVVFGFYFIAVIGVRIYNYIKKKKNKE